MIPGDLIPAVLANHLWQSTLCAAAAVLLALALRRNRAQTRYTLWLIASLKFLIPFSFLVAVGTHLKWPAMAASARPAFSAAIQQIGQPLLAPDIFTSVPQSTVPMHVGGTILLLIWLCGFLIVLASWLKHWLRIRAALRNAVPLPFAAPIRILSSPSLLEPGIFGLFRPVLVLPEGITGHLTAAHLDAILAHELCHVRRRDNLAAAIHMLVEALFWFHPLVWWIGTRLVEERERACDEEVLRLGNQPNVYAESILKTCQFYLESPLACMSGITGSDLKRRVVRIMSEGLAARLSFHKKVLLAAAGIAALAVPLAVGLTNASQASKAASPTFEVASIKPTKPGTMYMSVGFDPGGRFVAKGITVETLIRNAYDVESFRISGGPSWINSAKYDIIAKSSDVESEKLTEAARAELNKKHQRELQTLLAERFNFRFHESTKEQAIYDLVVSRNGPKLQPTKEPTGTALTMRPGQLTSYGISMPSLAANLSNCVRRVVRDKTGLSGIYAFTLRWADQDVANPPARDSDVGPGGSNAPSIFTAVREQLGLKLEPTKGPVSVLIIDHVERPSEN